MKIRFQAPLSGTLSNFPVLVSLSTNIPGFQYSDFSSPSNGADLRFAASNEETSLNYEIDSWNTNGSSLMWVQVPEITGTNDFVYAYWNSVAGIAPCTTNGSTWSNGFKSVWHMGQSGTRTDSSSNGFNGTADGTGVTPTSDGKVGPADIFSGVGRGYPAQGGINFGNVSITGDETIEMWIYPTGIGPRQNPMNKAYAGEGTITLEGSGNLTFFWGDSAGDSGSYQGVDSSAALPGSTWTHLVLVRNISGGAKVRWYFNGRQVSEIGAPYPAAAASPGNPLYLGKGYTDTFKGRLDEVRMSSMARSSNWVHACWLNQASNDAFIAFSDTGPLATSLTVIATAATGISDTAAGMNGLILHTGGLEPPLVYFCWGYADASTNSTSAWDHVQYMGNTWGKGQSFSTNLSGLLTGSNYAYRCYVTNSAGFDWSDTATAFRTLALPVVTNLGASSLGAQTATLRGQVTDAGGDTPSTWFYYWIDGQSTTTTVAKSTQSGVFTEALTGLLIGSNYSYRCAASNVIGLTLSGDKSFQTLANEYIWTGGGAGNLASTPANWLQGVAPTQATDLVRLNGTSIKDMTWDLTNEVAAWTQTADYTGTVTIATTYGPAFPVMVITGDCQILGGTWTHPVGSSGHTEIYHMRVDVGGDFTLGPSATVNLNGKGFEQNIYGGYGPGAPLIFGNYGPGASHGGLGGNSSAQVPLPWTKVYGSITSPTNLGSSIDLAGGGALWLSVQDSVTVDGAISASVGATSYTGDGAGGSVYITAGTFGGAGTIDVTGGAGGAGGGSGGGGRIAVVLSSGTTFGSVAMKAYGGFNWASTYQGAAAGTIYRQIGGQAAGHGSVTIDNNNYVTTSAMTMATPNEPDWTQFSEVVLTNRGFLALNTNTMLDWVAQPNLKVYGPGQSLLMAQTTNGISLSSDFDLANFALYLFTNLTVAGDMLVSNATFSIAAPMQSNLVVQGNLHVATNGSMAHWAGNEIYRLNSYVGGNLTIDAGGSINVDGLGFIRGSGPGAGAYGNNTLPAASHGGMGSPNPGITGQPSTYGSILTPTNFGSGAEATGGGAIQVTVAGTSVVNGAISARTGSSVGGAGGSIYLITGWLEGSGTLDASSPDFYSASLQYGGGGGRIAVYLTQSSSFGSVAMKAYGSDPLSCAAAYSAAAGTVYKQTAAQSGARGVLVVDNRGSVTPDNISTELPASIPVDSLDAYKYVTLDATNSANVEILSNLTMGDLYLRDDSVKLRLNGHTLTLKASYHPDWGTESRVDYTGGGRIVWTLFGTVFVIH